MTQAAKHHWPAPCLPLCVPEGGRALPFRKGDLQQDWIAIPQTGHQ